MQKNSCINFFLLPGYDTPGSQYFCNENLNDSAKTWMTQQKLDQSQKYFNPLVSGPGWFELWKKLGSKILLDCPLKLRKAETFLLNKHRYLKLSEPNSAPAHLKVNEDQNQEFKNVVILWLNSSFFSATIFLKQSRSYIATPHVCSCFIYLFIYSKSVPVRVLSDCLLTFLGL